MDYGFHRDNELMCCRRITLACRVSGPDIHEKPPPRLAIKPRRVPPPTMVYYRTRSLFLFFETLPSKPVSYFYGKQVLTFIVLDTRSGRFVDPGRAPVSLKSRCRNMVTSIDSICFAFAVREPCFFTCSLQEGPSSSHLVGVIQARLLYHQRALHCCIRVLRRYHSSRVLMSRTKEQMWKS